MVVATATGFNGQTHTCQSNTSDSCNFTDLHCGATYSVAAVTVDRGCRSMSTSNVELTTGPCDPTNVKSVLNCGSDSATVSWDAAAGAVGYTVLASEVGSQYETSCKNSTTSCQLNQLNCGKTYSLTILAGDATCNSTGTTATLNTAPCSPTIQSYNLNCGTNSSSLSWTAVQNATKYTISAQTLNNVSVSCESDTPECILPNLQCSERYIATVIAKGSECDSKPSSGFPITTAPCPPPIASTLYTCDTDTAVINWTAPAESTGFHAEVVGDYTNSCDTTNNYCVFQSLPCGLKLHLKVKAIGSQCNSTDSVSDIFETVPCAPGNVSASLICENHSVLVMWSESPTAVNYTVTVTGQDGHTVHCHNNTSSCVVPDIHCGQVYNITVKSHSTTCTGLTSDVYILKAGLCAPTSLSVSSECHISTVNWTHVEGAETVVATATGFNGQTHTCQSNTSDSCNFTDLHCGATYSVAAVTVDRGCRSMSTSNVELTTVQCPPTNLSSSISCGNNTFTITWDKGNVTGITYYLQSERKGSTTPPEVFTTGYYIYILNNLQCGERYNVSIAAKKGNCLSEYTLPIEISTAPCPPTNVSAHLDCETKNAVVTWGDAAVAAESYNVQGYSSDGNASSCNSTTTTCQLQHLVCGQKYTVVVMSVNKGCTGPASEPATFVTGPCQPDNVSVTYDCKAHSARLTWTSTSNASDYYGRAQDENGSMLHCHTNSPECTINGLNCGTVYNFSVLASDGTCNSSFSKPLARGAVPCPPENVTIQLLPQPMNVQILSLSWTESNCSNTEYIVILTGNLMGNNETQFEISSYWTSETFFEMPLPCSSEYSAKVASRNSAGTSCKPYTAINGTTDPCPPGPRGRRDLSDMTGNELILVVNQTSASTAFFISWNKVDDDSEYSLIATQQGSSTETQEFTVYGESTFLFKDLNPNSTYCFTVAVMLDADTRGPESAPVCAQTGPIKK